MNGASAIGSNAGELALKAREGGPLVTLETGAELGSGRLRIAIPAGAALSPVRATIRSIR